MPLPMLAGSVTYRRAGANATATIDKPPGEMVGCNSLDCSAFTTAQPVDSFELDVCGGFANADDGKMPERLPGKVFEVVRAWCDMIGAHQNFLSGVKRPNVQSIAGATYW